MARLRAHGRPEGASGDYAVSDTNTSGLNLQRRSGVRGPERIRVRELEDSDAAYGAVGDGEADWAIVPGAALATARSGVYRVLTARSASEAFLVLNASDPTLARVELRQAIAAAVDRDELVAQVYATLAEPATTIVPDGVPARQAETCADRCGGRDLARARALLAAAYPDKAVPTVRIDVDESTDQRTLARLLAAQLDEVGIPTEVHAEQRAAFRRRVAQREAVLFSFGWIGLYPSPGAYLDPLLRSSSADNVTGLASNSVNGALAAARGAEGDTAAEAWATAEREALAQAVVVPLAQYRVQAVVSERVEGLRHRLDGTFSTASLRVAP